jgi:hypothetical protein
MKKYFYISLIILVLFVSFVYADKQDSTYDAILSSAESFFKTMRDKDYPKIWAYLTLKSKGIIVGDVYKAEVKSGIEHSKEDIGRDFNTGGLLSRSYWNNYLEVFNPDTVLEQSKWEMGQVKKDRAEVIVRYKRSERPAILQMFKEDGVWKVGLEETFGILKK